MSLDTIAVFDCPGAEATPAWLMARLSADASFAADLIAHWRPRWQPQAWELDARPSSEYPTLYGPGGFGINWYGHTLQLYHMMPFRMFTGDAWQRQALQQACRRLAAMVGSFYVLYTHELMPHEGDDVQAIARWLTAHIGPPAVDGAELDAAQEFGPRAWLVEAVAGGGTSTST